MAMSVFLPAATASNSVTAWVEEVARLTRPTRVFWCDGSEDERARLTERAVRERILIPLNDRKRPGCYLHRSNPNDVARVEDAHLHLHAQGRGGADQQLDGARRDLREAAGTGSTVRCAGARCTSSPT